MKKYLFLILCLGVIKIVNLSFFTKEINICSIVSGFAGNLYLNEITVGSTDIEVIDYSLSDDNLTVIPANSKAILPISGIITDINNNFIKIEGTNSIYYVYNVKSNYRLYQYYNAGDVLGSSEEFIISSDNIIDIVSGYILNYEAI